MKPAGWKYLLAAALCLLLLAASASCKGGGSPAESGPADGTAESLPPPELLDFFGGNPSDCVILYPADANSELRSGVSDFAEALNYCCQLSLKCKADSTEKPRENAREILIGATNRAESSEAAELLRHPYDYVIRWQGNRLVILGGCEEATLRALEHLRRTSVTAGSDTLLLEEGLDDRWSFAERSAAALELAGDYRVLYGENASSGEKEAARCLAERLTEITGQEVTAASDYTSGVSWSETEYISPEKEILVGKTNRMESNRSLSALGPLDYEIAVSGNKVVLAGGGADATARAVARFVEALLQGEVPSLDDGSFEERVIYDRTYTSTSPEVTDFDSFVPVWADAFEPPEWMLELDEKIYAVTAPNARNMSASLGGDSLRYPSHSSAALASAVKAGVDLLVVNVYLTRDGIPVVLESGELGVLTDCDRFRGIDGLPVGTNVSEWSFEELQRLRLKNADHTASGYSVCSLYEVVRLCRGRCLLAVNAPPGVDLTDTLLSILQALDAFDCYYEIDPTNNTMDSPNTLRRLQSWRGSIQSDVLEQTVAAYEGALKRQNHWMRRLFSPTSKRRGLEPECAENWGLLADEQKNFLYTDDVVSYCSYIAGQASAWQQEDLRQSKTEYSISQDALLGRVLIISDIHYYPKNNLLGYDMDERMQLVVDQIMKEYNGRGLDAVLILGDLSTDDYNASAASHTEYYRQAYERYLKELPVPVYVLPGNHDSFSNDQWLATFGYSRQFSVAVGDMLFLMLDTFGNSAGNGEKLPVDLDWVRSEIAKYPGYRVVICSHYFSDADIAALQEIAGQNSRVLALFHGHTHQYEVIPGAAYVINDGAVAYTAFTDVSGTVWNFGYLDLRSLWGYQILEWSGDAAVTYRVLLTADYRATNMHYTVESDIRQTEIPLGRD